MGLICFEKKDDCTLAYDTSSNTVKRLPLNLDELNRLRLRLSGVDSLENISDDGNIVVECKSYGVTRDNLDVIINSGSIVYKFRVFVCGGAEWLEITKEKDSQPTSIKYKIISQNIGVVEMDEVDKFEQGGTGIVIDTSSFLFKQSYNDYDLLVPVFKFYEEDWLDYAYNSIEFKIRLHDITSCIEKGYIVRLDFQKDGKLVDMLNIVLE